jgi:hypothetical protein
MADSDQRFAAIVAALTEQPDVEQSTKKGFAQFGLKVGDKLFAMHLRKGSLLLKLPKARVDWLADSGDGERFDPGHGRVLKEWIAVRPDAVVDWFDLAREALSFVRQSPSSID